MHSAQSMLPAYPHLLANSVGRRFDLLAFGDPVLDIVLDAAAVPEPGGKVVGRLRGAWGGGTTANAACAAARLGLASGIFGGVGDDVHAGILHESLAHFGVDRSCLISVQGVPSALAITVLMPGGEKSIIYLPMPATPIDSIRLDAALSATRIVYAMPYDLDELMQLSKLARSHGTLVAIDLEPAVAPDPQAMRARAALADIVFFNEAGFVAGTGAAPGDAAMRSVLELGPALVAVTCGAAGAMAIGRSAATIEYAMQAAYPVEVVDTTGAGDTFNAAFLSAMLRGLDLAAALQFGCATASCTVTAIGARAGLPDRAQVERIVQQAQSGEYMTANPL